MTKEEYYKKVNGKIDEATREYKYPVDKMRVEGMKYNRISGFAAYVHCVVNELRCNDTAVIENMLDALTEEQKLALLTVDDVGKKLIACVITKCDDDFRKIVEKYLAEAFVEMAEEGRENMYIK